MGLYDSGTYNNPFDDQRETARERLLSLLDEQKRADQAVATQSDRIGNNKTMQVNSDWIGRGLKGAALGAPFGGVGAAIGGGLGALSGLVGGISAHHKKGEGWLSSIKDTLFENPATAFDSAVSSPLVASGVANLSSGYAANNSRQSSAYDYLGEPHLSDRGSGLHAGLTGPSYGNGPQTTMNKQPFQFSDDEYKYR